MTPYLTIAGKKFALQGDIADGYDAKIAPAAENKQLGKSHPTAWWYKGGKFDDIQIELHLFVGGASGPNNDSLELTTPQALLDAVADLVRLALPETQNQVGLPTPVMLQIGSWFSRVGYVKTVKHRWMGTWSEKGEPMQAKVTVTFCSDFTGGMPSVNRLSKLPTRKSFSWKS